MTSLTDYELGRAFKLLAEVQAAALELGQLGLREDPAVQAIDQHARTLMRAHRLEMHRRTTASSVKPSPEPSPEPLPDYVPTDYSAEARLQAGLAALRGQ